MNEEVKITCSNDIYKYSPDQIYDYIYELQNNWNELKKWLESLYTKTQDDKDWQCYLYVLKKLQELEGNNE